MTDLGPIRPKTDLKTFIGGAIETEVAFNLWVKLSTGRENRSAETC